jgi:hypothetical protein
MKFHLTIIRKSEETTKNSQEKPPNYDFFPNKKNPFNKIEGKLNTSISAIGSINPE